MAVWTWGSDGYGRLGLGTEDKHQGIPQNVRYFDSKVVKTAAIGAAHTIIVDTDGQCYTWGKCHYGQLGQGEMDEDIHVPRLLSFPAEIRISQVAAGDSHTLAVTCEGCVFSWGCGYYGALGHNTEVSLTTPHLIESLKDVTIVSVCGGASHSLAVTDSGRVYSWGRDHMGQLGLPPYLIEKSGKKFRLNQKTPVKVPLDAVGQVRTTAACASHTLLLLTTGKVLTFGDNTSGQLGRKDVTDDDIKQTVIPSEYFDGSSVSFVAAGSKHCAAVSKDGSVYTWGSGKYGRLGTGSSLSRSTPTRIVTHEKFVQVVCGEAHTMALSVGGRVWAWGSGHYGKLGLPVDASSSILAPQEVRNLPDVNLILSGTNHSMACKLQDHV